MERKYISCADTAKFIRAALKANFPTVKFSVQSHTYSGGASIRVKWADGPTAQMVERVAKQFEGGGFDGSIDMAYHAEHWLLPDGTAAMAHCEGTAGSKGSVPAVREWMPHAEARLVRFGADYVFCERKYSERFLRHAAARLARRGYPQFEAAKIVATPTGYVHLENHAEPVAPEHNIQGYCDLGTLLYRECQRLMVV